MTGSCISDRIGLRINDGKEESDEHIIPNPFLQFEVQVFQNLGWGAFCNIVTQVCLAKSHEQGCGNTFTGNIGNGPNLVKLVCKNHRNPLRLGMMVNRVHRLQGLYSQGIFESEKALAHPEQGLSRSPSCFLPGGGS